MSSSRSLRFMSWNSNGIESKKHKVIIKMRDSKCHVVFLQETHSSSALDELEDWKSFNPTPTAIIGGVAILIRNKIFDESSCTTESDSAGCYVVVKCVLKGQLFTLVSLYNPQGDPTPLLKLHSVIGRFAEGILLIGGDFNLALNPYLDRSSKTKNKSHIHFRPVVEKFITSFHLVDVWRRIHPTDMQFSYEQNTVKSRLDYLFVPEESVQCIKTCEISEMKDCSDHKPILFKIKISKEKKIKTEYCLDFPEENKMHIFNLIESVTDKWFSYKKDYWPDIDLTINPNTPLMVDVGDIESAIQSLGVYEKHVTRPDRIPLSFYKNNMHVLIPSLCAFYHNILDRPMIIPESFNMAFVVSKTHYIFNVDYLILATIMSRWLYDHLQSHSTDYTVDGQNNVILFAFTEQLVKIRWTILRGFIAKETNGDQTNPPLSSKLNTDILNRMLRNGTRGKYKFLCWGCPLTQALMTLCLKHVANELIVKLQDSESKVFISRENVIARLYVDCDRDLLVDLEQKYGVVTCEIMD